MNFKKIILGALLGSTILTACDKPDYVVMPKYNGPLKVNFNNYGGVITKQLSIANIWIDIPIEVKLTNTTDVAPADIKVKVQLDRNVLYDYNTDNGSSYIVPPDSAFEFVPTKEITVTIPKGQRRATITAKLNPGKLNLTNEYAMPFAVVDAVGAEVNSGDVDAKVVVVVDLKNKYDGVWKMTGGSRQSTWAGYATFMGNVIRDNANTPLELQLVTTGGSTVRVFYPASATNVNLGQMILCFDVSAQGYIFFGYCAPVFEFNLTSNALVSVVNVFGQPAPQNGRSLVIDAAVTTSRYVPGSPAKMFLAYKQLQAGRGDVFIKDTLEFVRPR